MDLEKLFAVYFNLDVAQRYLPDILQGMLLTLQLSIGVILSGLVLGLALAIVRLVSPRWIIEIIRFMVDCLRAMPPLVLILIVYFGLPSVGVPLPGFWVMFLTLTFVLMAFAEEIFWAGITAIPKGQWEGSRSTGMTMPATLVYVILPQAMRICVPPLVNRTMAITKNTALGTAIGMPELLSKAQAAQSLSGNATPLVMASIAYLIIFMPLMTLAGHLEKRMRWGARS